MVARPRSLALLVAVVCAVSLAGALTACGGDDDNAAGEALGARTEQDFKTLDKFFEAGKPVPEHNADFARALQEENVRGARAALDKMTGAVREIDRIAGEVESPELRRTLDDYVGGLRGATVAYERVMAYLESDEPANAAREQRLFRDVQRAVREAQVQDRRLVDRIAAALPEDERKEFRERFEKQLKGYQERAQPRTTP